MQASKRHRLRGLWRDWFCSTLHCVAGLIGDAGCRTGQSSQISGQFMQYFKTTLIVVLTIAMLGLVQFLACTAYSIATFPEGYSFSNNYLSDLGRKSVENSAIFNGSMMLLGICLIPLFGMITAMDTRQSISAKLTTAFGIVSALGIVGMGMTPIDRQYISHHIALAIWLFPMLYLTISFFYVVARSPHVGIWFLSGSLLMVVGMIVVLLNTQLSTYELLQKAIVICGLIWVIYVIAFICQSGITMLKGWTPSDDRREEKEKEYFSTLVNDGARRTID